MMLPRVTIALELAPALHNCFSWGTRFRRQHRFPVWTMERAQQMVATSPATGRQARSME